MYRGPHAGRHTDAKIGLIHWKHWKLSISHKRWVYWLISVNGYESFWVVNINMHEILRPIVYMRIILILFIASQKSERNYLSSVSIVESRMMSREAYPPTGSITTITIGEQTQYCYEFETILTDKGCASLSTFREKVWR